MAERHRFVAAAVQEEHGNGYLRYVEPPGDELSPAVVVAALDAAGEGLPHAGRLVREERQVRVG